MKALLTFTLSLWLALSVAANPLILLSGSPPAAAPAGTDPASVANRVIHVIGDDTTGADGDAVVTWPAATGTSNAGAGNNNPTKQTNEANGHTVVRFSSSYVGFADVLSGLSAGTGYIVVRLNADPPAADASAGFWSTGTSAQGAYYPYPGDGIIYDEFGTTSRKTTLDPGPSLTVFRVYAVSSAASAWTSYLDGSLFYNTGTNTVGFRTTPTIGSNVQEGPYLAGDVAEFIVYSDAHNATTVGNISAFLKAKYNP